MEVDREGASKKGDDNAGSLLAVTRGVTLTPGMADYIDKVWRLAAGAVLPEHGRTRPAGARRWTRTGVTVA